ncbi:MAG: Uma2 family endonuclease [Gammaproteobacteria bacterium]|nr:Uma2 family endonuclease [Gammaproteobacteria bacterium]
MPARAGYQDVMEAPTNHVAEVVGVLYTNPRPPPLQALAKSSLGANLSSWFQFGRGGPGGWWILDEPELHLGEDIVVPDSAGWRRKRMPEYLGVAFLTLAPDWICEVLSPSTRRLDLNGKSPIYAREGIRHLWFVDPADRTMEAFELRKGQWVLIGTAKEDAPVCIPPFDAITFSLADLWP